MKKIVLSMFYIIIMNMLQAQNANEIIENYIERIGGYKNWKELEGIKKIIRLDNISYVDSIITIHLKNGKQYKKTIMPKIEVIDCSFDGIVAWSYASINKDIKILNENQTEKVRLEKEDFPSPFIDYKKKGFTLKLLGQEMIKETLCYKIKLTKNTIFINNQVEDNIVYYFFSIKTFLPVLIETEIKVGMMKGKIREDYLSDYRKVGNLYFPFKIYRLYKNTSMKSHEIIKSIELNPNVNDSIFTYNPKK